MKKSYYIILTILLLLCFGFGFWGYSVNAENSTVEENKYNYSFSEVVNYVNNIENYLAKAMISKSSTHSSETLSKIWADSNLAIVYFENIPFVDEGTNKSIKFLNQVSDYAYTLSKKTINGEELSEEDFEKLKTLYNYCTSLKDVLNELSTELNNGTISWEDLNEQTDWVFVEEDVTVFSSIESNFDDYEGLIYDGAYSDFVTKSEKIGLTGDEIDEETAKTKIEEFFADKEIQEITSNGEVNGNEIEAYSFTLKTNKSNEIYVDISKKGGWFINVICDKEVGEPSISEEEAVELGKQYLDKMGYLNMKETYYTIIENIVTINYAYTQNDIIMYPDLIKVKIALDDGEILGIEATGYLNNHVDRGDLSPRISVDEARENLNKNLEILSEGLAVIPKENTEEEVFCYEFKGRVEGKEFLVYINAETGEEEEILVILETAEGVLTI